ncbi:unnamed protein product [Lupinus luteus]|uniref:Uncharacterized protein n=1 Tax=Lupinus luteus TaxID=3873 RepID=A0AAV1X0C3_LUPLU
MSWNKVLIDSLVPEDFPRKIMAFIPSPNEQEMDSGWIGAWSSLDDSNVEWVKNKGNMSLAQEAIGMNGVAMTVFF